jgi:tRNA pseudouridine55 synthase
MATGLLVLGIGSSTRLLTYVVGTDKEYHATIRLGLSTTTDDADGEVLREAPAGAIGALSTDDVLAGIQKLTGEIEQVPSTVSAIKVEGKRAYARVRAGEYVVLEPRPVTISAFELLGYEPIHTDDEASALDLMVRVECSSGTYIRALARDLGADLDVGGHLTELRRTRVGPFEVSDAAPLDGLDVASRLMSPATAASALFGTYAMTEQQAIDLSHGKVIHVPEHEHTEGPIAAVSPSGHLVGLIELRGQEGRSLVNFPADELAPGTTS